MTDNNPDGGISADTFLMEDKLSKIRSQINSKLDNQKNLAIVLSAVEENIDEQKNDRSAVSYFVSFLSLLDQAVKDDTIVDNNLATSAAYFLDIVVPFTPKPLLKAKFGDILAKLATPLTSSDAEAPLVRSTVGTLENLLLAQDHQQWSYSGNISPKRGFLGMLELALDPRPKVRKRAQEAIHNILMNPPASPSSIHVASPLAAELSLTRLVSLVESSRKGSKKGSNKESNSQIIHTLQLITAITSANSWPATQIEQLCDVLLEISKTSDQYLVSSAFTSFEGLFKSMSNVIDIEKFTKVLDIIFDLKPSINDSHLAASWLAVVAKALECFATLSPETCLSKIPSFLPIVSEFLGSESKDIYSSASQCLIAIVVETIPDKFLLQPTQENGISGEIYELMDNTVTFFAEYIEKELLSIKYQHATREILEFITAAILKLRTRSNPDFLNILEIVGQWRTNEAESFAHNKEAEDVIAASISTMGPEVVLSTLPLNLSNGNQPGRAWLLPLLRDNVRFTNLGYYKAEILPLVQFFEGKINNASNKESINIKIFQTIIDQIWSLLPHFCDLPKDLTESFDDEFAANLSDIMYSNVELRVPICHALKLLVESNVAYSEGVLANDLLVQEEFTIEQSKKALEYLSSKASNILSVFFNIFSSTLPEGRGFILETINSYLQIIPKNDLENTFNKVCGLLKNAMDSDANEKSNPKSKVASPKMSFTMMDLVVAMAKYVPQSSHNALFSIFSSTVNAENEALMQKRSYRILARLAETEIGKQSMLNFMNEIEKVLIETSTSTHNSARASRLSAINLLLDILPQSDLFFIPAILQEIILTTKDTNERTRELSYSILIKMGKIMADGGVIVNTKVPGFAPDTPDSGASLTEYFTMVSAGLAAQTPHMISATITALSCLVFEFKNELSTDVLLEISSTVELFLTHNAREIAKSAIGFVKVEVLSLPEDIVRANLHKLLEKLMRWSHEHKGHFKSKVKHILERLIRKFGIEEVEQAIPEEDRKLIANIKKTRNRAKRREQEDADGSTGDRKFVSAYEEALYDSEDSDDEEDVKTTSNKKGKGNQFILEAGDEPLNLLDRQILTHISSKPKRSFKKELSKKASEFTSKNGKLVFKDDASEDPFAAKGSGIDAYLDAIKQAPIRGQKNKLKFKKSKDNEEDWDGSDDEPEVKPTKKIFKGKVSGNKISKPKQKFKSRKKF